uniref:Uncharacterized protein n=1 Tax=Varanus komodoensis TaxID=61221 RepID=A0A8D2LEY5_VARKO
MHQEIQSLPGDIRHECISLLTSEPACSTQLPCPLPRLPAFLPSTSSALRINLWTTSALCFRNGSPPGASSSIWIATYTSHQKIALHQIFQCNVDVTLEVIAANEIEIDMHFTMGGETATGPPAELALPRCPRTRS